MKPETKAPHTPTLDVYRTQDGKYHIDVESDGTLDYVGANPKENLSYIKRAVNSHEELLGALKDVLRSLEELYVNNPTIAGSYFGRPMVENMENVIARGERK